jgi:hypothetical protein
VLRDTVFVSHKALKQLGPACPGGGPGGRWHWGRWVKVRQTARAVTQALCGTGRACTQCPRAGPRPPLDGARVARTLQVEGTRAAIVLRPYTCDYVRHDSLNPFNDTGPL